VSRFGGEWVADSERVTLRWYVPRDDVTPGVLAPGDGQTFCPYKGLCSYYDVGERRRAAWSYLEAWPEVVRVAGYVSFEPDLVDVTLDGRPLRLEPGQVVIPPGVDRGLGADEIRSR
jgi:uncharacterized protein (DUF427 family)